jgi:hypothetical protein
MNSLPDEPLWLSQNVIGVGGEADKVLRRSAAAG